MSDGASEPTPLTVPAGPVELVLESTDAVLARIDALSAADRAQVADAWLARLRAAPAGDPWTHGFAIVAGDGRVVGSCGYTGPPDGDGVVEIAYGVDPEHRGRGYATAAAAALTAFAFDTGLVRRVCAHTRPVDGPSPRVLARCGFARAGDAVDDAAGPVWRWERGPGAADDDAPWLRRARPDDLPALRALIERSVRGLSVGHYSPAQIEAGLAHVFGVDSQLVADGSYYVVASADGPCAAGGWSARGTLFGGDQAATRRDTQLDPARDAARIRAFFVEPRWARRGLARRLYRACAAAAASAGFRRLELMATVPGIPLYTALGFAVVERVEVTLPGDVPVPFARMTRDIAPPTAVERAAVPPG